MSNQEQCSEIQKQFNLQPALKKFFLEEGYLFQEGVFLNNLMVNFWLPDYQLAIDFLPENNPFNPAACQETLSDGVTLLHLVHEKLTMKATLRRLKLVEQALLKNKAVKELSERKIAAFRKPKKKDEFTPPETAHELLLLGELKRQGYKVLHNHKICGYYPDIFLPDWNLAVEIDGGYHDSDEQKKADKHRSKVLRINGITVVRIKNEMVENHLFRSVNRIKMMIEKINKKKRKKNKSLPKQKQKKIVLPPEKVSHPHPIFDDPNWEALACKKLGIDPAKPKRTPINA